MAQTATINIGQLLAAGRLEEVRSLLKRHLSVQKKDAAALRLLGKVEFQLGQKETGIRLLRKAIALVPQEAELHYELGTLYLSCGMQGQAITALEAAVRRNPDHHDALYNLGWALLETERYAEAVQALEKSLALRPDQPKAWYNLGNARWRMGDAEAATAAYEQALGQQAVSRDLLYNYGLALAKTGRLAEAEEALRKVISLAPANAPDVPAGCALASVLGDLGRRDEAESLLFALAEEVPQDPQVICALAGMLHGGMLFSQEKLLVLLPLLASALNSHPENVELWNWTGLVQMRVGQYRAAVEAFDQALALRPGFPATLSNLAVLHSRRGDPETALDYLRKAHEAAPEDAAVHSNLLFTLQHSGNISAEELFIEHCRFGEYQETRVKPLDVLAPGPDDAERRLRVGFVSPDFRSHAVSFFFEPLLEHLDGKKVESYCYYTGRARDEVTVRLQAAADHWRDLPGLTADTAAQLVRQDEIDILIDLAGHTAGNALPVFARKPAPVQVTWLGYPATTGLSRIDYRLTNWLPDGKLVAEDPFHTEKLLKLRYGATFRAPVSSPAVVPPPLLHRGRPTFGSLNKALKISDGVFATWCSLLHRVPDADLLMIAGGVEDGPAYWKNRFAAEGIEPARIHVKAPMPLEEFLHLFAEIDIALDPFPYSGGTTSLLTTWMGVPLICMDGLQDSSGSSSVLMRSLGLGDLLVARNEDNYVQLAAALASDRERLAELRTGLREKMAALPSMDPATFAKEFVSSLRHAWWIACGKQPA
ncbi:tetratricopeptide repeat protein [Telmatospirillum sp. J64-1]|uniref:O-linked N-acetylglucosamine transferase family protein n=1 Tax=Telmatospirillum sp. J64-1 TaxID=2502183 RepID=UPI00115D7A9A|nr:tetratricopeptide repeat protein [Telmatospirillum sp. J64-1]